PPSRSVTPGRNASSTTSARPHNAGPSPGSRTRSQSTDSLPPLSALSHSGAASRSGSPSGASSRTTRAPRRNSSRLANGPGRFRVRSTTRMPASGCTMLRRLTERSNGGEDKRGLILHAAVRVVIREVVRSPELQRRISEIHAAFAAIERIIVRGQEEGEFRSDVDPRLASFVFYGALEEILTGWVLGTLDDGDEQIARAEQT